MRSISSVSTRPLSRDEAFTESFKIGSEPAETQQPPPLQDEPRYNNKVMTEEEQEVRQARFFYNDAAANSGRKNAERGEVIELTLEYLFFAQGEQVFEVIDNEERIITKIKFPHRGGMLFAKGEVRLPYSFLLGGKVGTSLFNKVNNTDASWMPAVQPGVWWETTSRTDARVLTGDLNLYYRLLDSQTIDIGDPAFCELLEFLVLKPFTFDVSFDVFSGYQFQRGYYKMKDIVDMVEWWAPTVNPLTDQDSYYRVLYYGPQWGFRTEVAVSKLVARFSLAYAWLQTKGNGWWNLQNYTFEHKGDNGYGLDIQGEVAYKFAPCFSAGLGYMYLERNQGELVESGNNNGAEYSNMDIIRNADSRIHGPYAVIHLNW